MPASLQEIHDLLARASRIVLTTHVRPDGDALGSMLGMYHYLCAQHKDVLMLLDDIVPDLYDDLPGCGAIRRPAGIVAADLLLALDAADLQRAGSVGECVSAPVLNVDHHISNTRYGQYCYVNDRAAATGEIVFDLIAQSGAEMTKEIAECLYTAIATDCGFFRYANTTDHTLRCAASLVSYGARPNYVAERMERKPLSAFNALREALAGIEFYHDNRIAVMTLSSRLLQEAGSFTEGFINYPRSIDGVEVAILFKVETTDIVRVSFRSHEFDVNQLAAVFGGGGHVRASGCTLTGSLEAVKQKVIREASARMGEAADERRDH